jgi:hypothetical protein
MQKQELHGLPNVTCSGSARNELQSSPGGPQTVEAAVPAALNEKVQATRLPLQRISIRQVIHETRQGNRSRFAHEPSGQL